jgi:hypothetical protein
MMSEPLAASRGTLTPWTRMGRTGSDRTDDGAAGAGGGRMSDEARELHRNIRASVRDMLVGAIDSAVVHRRWKRVLRAADVRYRPPEQLRHTFASTMLSRNAPCPTFSSRLAGAQRASCSQSMPDGCRRRSQRCRFLRPSPPQPHPSPQGRW